MGLQQPAIGAKPAPVVVAPLGAVGKVKGSKKPPALVVEKEEEEEEEYHFAPFEENNDDDFGFAPQSMIDFNFDNPGTKGDKKKPQKKPGKGKGEARGTNAGVGSANPAGQVFSNDGSFADKGFVITSQGITEQPGALERKNSAGMEVEGVPKSGHEFFKIRSLDEIEIVRPLGRGASGVVNLGLHVPSGIGVAIKLVNVYDEQKRVQLMKELETLSSYESRFLVRFYGAFYDGAGSVHIALEFMDGGALDDLVNKGGPVPETVVNTITKHCLLGLRFLHHAHVLHRDFKTANILISRQLGRAKLSDFGLARDLNAGQSRADTFVGTLAYMSPERLHGSPYTYAGDIWGLGVSVVECLLGKYPFQKPQSFFDYIDVTSRTDSLLPKGAFSPECHNFVTLCTNIDPKRRPTTDQLLEHPWIANSKFSASGFNRWLDSTESKGKKKKSEK